MRTTITTLAAALLLVVASVGSPANAGGFGGPFGFNHHYPPPIHYPPPPIHYPPPPEFPHGLICKKTVIIIPQWTPVAWGHFHGHRGPVYIKKIVIICFRPFST
jgi:hypothetical protein